MENGTTVVSFSIATSETYKDRNSGDRIEKTEWHNVVLWRGLAEVAEKYLHKGDQVYIEGKLRTRSWEKEGVTRYTTEIVGDNMKMLSKRSGGAAQQSGAEQQKAPTTQAAKPEATEAQNNEELDDLPF